MDNNTKIYSIQKTKEGNILAEIETTILNGLYKFSILGSNQKNINDTKDKIYSALRFQKIMNLKSDNKKITVNILPKNTENFDNVYDLSIALSLLKKTNRIQINTDSIVLGELSILGKIISTQNILSGIYQALENKIELIICTNKDINNICNTNLDLIKIITDSNLKFISADTLEEIIHKIDNKDYYNFINKNKSSIKNSYEKIIEYDKNILKVIFSLCTNNHLLICKNQKSSIFNFLKNLIFYKPFIRNNNILYLSNHLAIADDVLINDYISPYINIINFQTRESDIINELNKSIYGFNIIDNILNIDKNVLYNVKTKNKSSVICFYTPCPCENLNSIFNDGYNKCLCLQRNITRHLNKIKLISEGFFGFKINEDVYIDKLSVDEYINIHNFILDYKNNNYKNKFTKIEFYNKIIDELRDTNNIDLDKIIDLFMCMEKFLYIIKPDNKIRIENIIRIVRDLIKTDS